MISLLRRWVLLIIAVCLSLMTFRHLSNVSNAWLPTTPSQAEPYEGPPPAEMNNINEPLRWSNRKLLNPVTSITPLPTGSAASISKIQHDFKPETVEQKKKRETRLAAIREAFVHSWNGYKKYAWMHDEVTPLSGSWNDKFGGWGATLVDTLDTLLIMDMKDEFEEALKALNGIDFGICEESSLSVFETNIRYLGGLLSAFDLSNGKYQVLLEKAEELGQMLYMAFDTPNRMPLLRWDCAAAASGAEQEASSFGLLAEIGSLSLEFTRLSQLTGDSKYYDAIDRIMVKLQEQQNTTKLPGLWPVMVDPHNANFNDGNTFTLGGMADSTYEYLPKEWLLLSGRNDAYKEMYLTALESVKKYLVFQPLVPESSYPNPEQSPLILGTATASGYEKLLDPEVQHLTCFAGGMIAIASRLFPSSSNDDLDLATRLTHGCIWSYAASPSGIAPEIFFAEPCSRGLAAITANTTSTPEFASDETNCTWDKARWIDAVASRGALPSGFNDPEKLWENYVADRHLSEGFTQVSDSRYLLRPEAIESVWVLYRVTGDERLREHAWRMWEAVSAVARTSVAYAGVNNVMIDVNAEGEDGEIELSDSMESFWTAETLKYFYLLFSEPSVVSLDEYVLNTEAHPLRWKGS